ncbi:hypothetical protein [Riemerella anatipestifer]|uniref:hypothetical protein n=1 Tax=Riemerella anatipestifer TaxID=34085 RepID=UPI00069AE0BB|nr:hypothetical protein [Riemerella anatipestifer]
MKTSKIVLIIFFSLVLLNCNKNDKVNYIFLGKDLCNDGKGMPVKFITQADEKRYGVRKIYDLKINKGKISIVSSFKIINNCCQIPKDSLRIVKDTIVIIPSFEKSSLCDSYCEYLFEYKFLKEDLNNKNIIVLEE